MVTDRQRQIAEAVAQHGSHRRAAAALGVNHSTVDKTMSRIRKNDPAWAEQAAARGFDAGHAGWIKWPAQDGAPGASVYVGKERGAGAIEGVIAALDAYTTRHIPSPAPQFVDADLLNLVAVPDWHAGLMAWRRSTGADYDLRIAADCLAQTLGRVIPRLPPAGAGILLALGDTTHTNDARNVTPKSAHQLDVDGRYLKIMEIATTALIGGVDMMLDHHTTVEAVIIPGNHDPEAAQMLALVLRAWFRNDPRVTVWDGGGDWWKRQHGKVMIAATHGHKIRQQQMAGYAAAEWPEMWGATRARFAFSGHVHHERTLDTPGMLCEAMRPVTDRDAYAAGAWHSQREISGMTFSADGFRVSRVYEVVR